MIAKIIREMRYRIGFDYAGIRIPIGLWCIKSLLWNIQDLTIDHRFLTYTRLWCYHFLSILCDIKFFRNNRFTPGALNAWIDGKKFLGIPYTSSYSDEINCQNEW